MLSTSNPALIIVDLQNAIDCFSGHERNNLSMEKTLSSFLSKWRSKGLQVIHVRHSSKFKDSPYHANSDHFGFKKEVLPIKDELIITKSENSAFIGTELDSILKKIDVQEIVVCGVLANNSIDATVRHGAGLGYKIIVPSDLTASFGIDLINGGVAKADDVHLMFLSNLNKEYCHVVSSSKISKNV